MILSIKFFSSLRPLREILLFSSSYYNLSFSCFFWSIISEHIYNSFVFNMLHSNFTPVNFLCFYYFLRALCAFVRHIFISLRFSHEGTKNTKKNIFLICDYRCPSVAKTRLVAAMPPYVLRAFVREKIFSFFNDSVMKMILSIKFFFMRFLTLLTLVWQIRDIAFYFRFEIINFCCREESFVILPVIQHNILFSFEIVDYIRPQHKHTFFFIFSSGESERRQ